MAEPLLLCLGKELADLRNARGWTRGRVATLLRRHSGTSITPRAVGSYETAERALTVARFFDLCAVYDTPASVVVEAAQRRARADLECPQCRRPL